MAIQTLHRFAQIFTFFSAYLLPNPTRPNGSHRELSGANWTYSRLEFLSFPSDPIRENLFMRIKEFPGLPLCENLRHLRTSSLASYTLMFTLTDTLATHETL